MCNNTPGVWQYKKISAHLVTTRFLYKLNVKRWCQHLYLTMYNYINVDILHLLVSSWSNPYYSSSITIIQLTTADNCSNRPFVVIIYCLGSHPLSHPLIISYYTDAVCTSQHLPYPKICRLRAPGWISRIMTDTRLRIKGRGQKSHDDTPTSSPVNASLRLINSKKKTIWTRWYNVKDKY